MARQTNAVIENERARLKERRERKRQERVDRRTILGCWMAFSSDAFAAMNTMDRADKELGAKSFIPLVLLLCATCAYGQGIPVVADTNQVKLVPTNIVIRWETNLFYAYRVQYVSTNWSNDGLPKKMTLPNGAPALLQKQDALWVTNVEHHLTFDGETRIWKVSQSFRPTGEWRETLILAPPEAPFVAVPTRQQR